MPFAFVTFLVLSLAVIGLVASTLLGPPTAPAQSTEANRGSSAPIANTATTKKDDPASSLSPFERIRQDLAQSLATSGDRLQNVQELSHRISATLETVQVSDAGKRIAGSDDHFPKLVALIRYLPERETV